jgi:hypothetical protein
MMIPTDIAPTPGLSGDMLTGDGVFTIPESIRSDPIWVVYTQIDDDGQLCSWRCDTDDQKKVPCNPESVRPSFLSWSELGSEDCVSFDDAFNIVSRSRQDLGNEQGLSGVMLALNAPAADGLCAFDLDDCIDPNTGEMEKMAQELVNDLDTLFWEISPSGSGLHAYLWDEEGLSDEYKQKDVIECYTSRCITFTGKNLAKTSTSIPDIPGLFSAYQKKYNNKKVDRSERGSDVATSAGTMANYRSPIDDRNVDINDLDQKSQELIDFAADNSEHFDRLFYDGSSCYHEIMQQTNDSDRQYSSTPDSTRSAADMSLLRKIYWWAYESDYFDSKEFSLMDVERIFLASDLAQRPKCIKRKDYVRYTIEKISE